MNNSSNFSVFNDYQKCYLTNGIIRYFGTFIFLIGMISTILSVAVFAQKPLRRKSCCFYFLILAISDSIHLLTVVIENLPYSFHFDLIILHTSLCKMIIFLIYFSNHLSNISLTLASIDRFILIYCPSRSKRFCHVKKAKSFVLISILVLCLFNGHLLFGYERIHWNEKQSMDFYDCNIRKENLFYVKLFAFYDSYVESICFVLLPFLVMSFCSLLIILQIFQTRKTIRYNTRGKFYYYTFPSSETIRKTFKEERRTRLRDKDIQLCTMLIGTTLAFLFLCLPTEINDIFNYTGREHSCFHWSRKVLLMLLQQIYYAGHFYIYILTGQLFRKHLYMIIFGQRYFTSQMAMTKDSIYRGRRLTNFSQEQYTKTGNGYSRTSCRRTSYINRPQTTIHQLTSIWDPSERLLSEKKTSSLSH